ncbi:hypothetical protein AVEN_50499-1 [Araneus ventricosus]|uniref:Uncharacterized protein n=1 Tax=Araneus ventricosus TaxID=182803 RepID=A0A4Y2ASF2_ARAVE|nr:hypothetical protein AVEN_50499-1 [Araneus ventricosus]
MNNVPHFPDISETRKEYKKHSEECNVPETSCEWENSSVTNQLKHRPKTIDKVLNIRELIERTVDEDIVKEVKILHKSDALHAEEDFSQNRCCEYKSCDRNSL